MDCIYTLGSEEQKQIYLPDCVALKKICSFGLTEWEYGSDATSIQTTAKPVEGGYLINGNKRWIGNVTIGDYMILWARNTETKKIQGFVLDLKSKGVDAKKIEGKYALWIVQNADVTFKDVFVPANAKLEKADDFVTGAN